MNKNNLKFWLLVFISYFATRLINLTIIPIFTDEAIYSYWAQVALHDPANRFISLEDGKQPLFIWLAAIIQRFVGDPLVATRLVSVLSGFGATIGIYLLAKNLFNERVARISSFLYIILPFTLLYDRMALFDSLLTMLGIYAVLLTVKLVQDLKLDTAILAGFAVGASMITKSSGSFFLYLMPFSLLLLAKNKLNRKNLIKWAALAGVTFIISQLIYNSLRLSPLFYIISRKNLSFIRPISEVIKDPFLHAFSNLTTLLGWIIAYLGPLLFLVFIASLAVGLAKKNPKVLYLAALILAPFLAEVLFNQVLYPRFVLFYFPYIIILIAAFFGEIFESAAKYQKAIIVLFAVAVAIPATSSIKLLTEPTLAKIPASDAGQYLNDWPAGYGVKEVVDFIKNQDQTKQIYVGTEGTFGLLPFALQIYFFGQENIHIIGFWPVDSSNLPSQIIEVASHNPTYFVFNENQKEITNSRLELVARYQKGIGNTYMRLFQITPP